MPTSKANTKKKPVPVPSKAAVDLLKGVSKNAQESQAKKKATAPPGPETLPDNWGLSDLVRVGKSRLSHAFFGPPKTDK